MVSSRQEMHLGAKEHSVPLQGVVCRQSQDAANSRMQEPECVYMYLYLSEADDSELWVAKGIFMQSAHLITAYVRGRSYDAIRRRLYSTKHGNSR